MPAKMVSGIKSKIHTVAIMVRLLKFRFSLGVCAIRGGSLLRPIANRKTVNAANKTIYNEILKEADCVEYIAETYTANCMHDRNRRLVDKSDMCVAFFEHSGGGTAYTVAYALKQGKEVINIAELI